MKLVSYTEVKQRPVGPDEYQEEIIETSRTKMKAPDS